MKPFALVTRNLPLKLLALAAAFVFWLNVANEPEMATIVSVPVEFTHYPDGLEISSPITESVSLEARGPAGEIRSLRDAHLAAVIDFSSVREPAERTFSITPAEIRLPRGVSFVRATPAQLRYRFERSVTKRVPVYVPYSGSVAPGFTLDRIEVIPPDLVVSGPESRVAPMYSLGTDVLDLNHVAGDTQQTLNVNAGSVRISGDARVTVRIHVKPAH